MNKLDVLVFGASDPEANRAAYYAAEKGLEVLYLGDRGEFRGKPFEGRVMAAAAYRQQNPYLLTQTEEELDISYLQSKNVGFFECKIEGVDPVMVFDHHNPGDPGYDKGPEQFKEGSSLGQLMTYLAIPPTQEDLFIMAADHCPTAAYRGECPGVDPAELAVYRVRQNAIWRGVDPDQEVAKFWEGVDYCKALPVVEIAPGIKLGVDLIGAGHPQRKEASSYLGLPLLYHLPARKEGEGDKVGILNGDSAHIEWFLDWAKNSPLVEGEYGNPHRGFCGAYPKEGVSPQQIQDSIIS